MPTYLGGAELEARRLASKISRTTLFNISVTAELQGLQRQWGKSSLAGTAGGIVVEGVEEVKENVEALRDGIISQCAMQSKIGAKAIKDFAYHICPEKSGALKSTGKVSEVDVTESAVMDEMIWPTGVGPANFTFTQKQRMVYEVSFGGEAANGINVDYAAFVHEAEGITIHTDVNPDATDHYLFKAYEEYKDYIPRRIVERVQAQIIRAGMRATAARSSVASGLVHGDDDEVPF